MKYLKLLTILLLLPVLTYADFDTSLKYGAKGDKVVELQEFLIEKGFLNSEPTGNFYSLTLKAVKAFQTAYNLPSTGYFGIMSRTKANEILALENNAELEEVGSITSPVDTTINKQLEDLNKKIEQQNAIIELQKQTQSQTNVILEQIKNNTNKVMGEPTPTPTPAPKEIIKELNVYAYHNATSTSSQIVEYTPLENGGASYFQKALGYQQARILFIVDYKVDGKRPDEFNWKVSFTPDEPDIAGGFVGRNIGVERKSRIPKNEKGDISKNMDYSWTFSPTIPALYTLVFEVDGVTREFKVDVK